MEKKLTIALSFLLLFSLVVGLLSNVSAYSCLEEEDNEAVKEFKSRMNIEAINHDLNKGVDPKAIGLKIKYFSKCND